MSDFLKNKTFKNGFILGTVLFLLAQVISFLFYFVSTTWIILKTPDHIIFHGFWGIGFPFWMYYGMYDFYHGNIDFSGLLGNLIFGTGLSFLIGLILKFWTKNQPQKLK